jgi:hypothetical protein
VGALELDLAGEVLHRWDDRGDDLDPTWIPVTFRAEHHEVTEVGPDELVTLTHRALAVDTYPRSYEPPRIELPATLEDTGVVRFRRDGTVLSTWWYGDVLDTRRIGFDSLDGAGLGYDWVHGNAVVRRPEGGWLASARHQDALFALDDDGALEWILASPAGWSDALAPKVLALDGTPTYHQHGPAYDDAGRLVVFDNHNEGHNPYEPPPEGPVQSRVVAYEIDAPAHRAREVWSWTHPDGLYSAALGNATPVPGGNVVACYGFLDGEGPDDAAAPGPRPEDLPDRRAAPRRGRAGVGPAVLRPRRRGARGGQGVPRGPRGVAVRARRPRRPAAPVTPRELLTAALVAADGAVDPTPIALARAALDEPVRALVVGRRGAGKSSLVTWWTGKPRPVGLGGVTRTAEEVVGGGWVLVDTPGFEGTDDAVIHVLPLAERAEVVVWVTDGLQAWTSTERAVHAALAAPRPAGVAGRVPRRPRRRGRPRRGPRAPGRAVAAPHRVGRPAAGGARAPGATVPRPVAEPPASGPGARPARPGHGADAAHQRLGAGALP